MTTQTISTASRVGSGASLGRRLGWLRDLALLPVIALTMIIGAVVTPNFLTLGNIFNNVLVISAVLGMVVLAESIILISGYFDLSLESTVGLAPMLAAWLVVPAASGGLGLELPGGVAVVVMLFAGAAIGLFNGIMIAVFKLNAFMVTLAMLILLRGLCMGISGGETLSGLPDIFTALGSTYIAGISIQVWIVVVAFAVAAVFMRHHPTGRKIYAMGGNEEAARAAGINTTRLTIGIFVVGSVVASFAGLMLTSRIASVTANQGDGMIFTVFAAAVIGGISLNGGRGTLVGALTGVILLGIIQNILTLSNVPSFWINAVYGVIILGALIFGHFAGSRSTRTAG
jgi:simple sugar transport system permease protein